MYRSIIYFNFQPFTKKRASKLIDSIIDISPVKLDKFGLTSSRMKAITPDKKEVLSKFVTGSPEYIFGTLFLSDKKGDINIYIEHHVNQFLRLDISFSSKLPESDRVTFFEKITDQNHAVFGLIDSLDKYDEKHLSITKHDDGGQTEEYLGFDFYNGIPGLYQYTYFGIQLSELLKIDNLTSAKKLSNGFLLNFNDSILEESTIKNLGEEYFFNIENKNEKSTELSSFQIVIDQVKEADRSIKPYYQSSNFMIEGNKAEKIFQEKIEKNLENPHFEDSSCEEIEALIKKLTRKLSTDNNQNEIELGCGYMLGLYWSKKFSKKFDIDRGLTFTENEIDFILNPYNTVQLLCYDNLVIKDIEDCVSYL